MRILFISTFYPPYIVGGWEQLVEEINQRLQARGHTTHVLASQHGVDQPIREPGVDRLLTLEGDLLRYKPHTILTYRQRLRQNMAAVRQTVETFKPNVIFIHIMWNLSPAIAWTAEQLLPGRVIYYMADHWTYAPDPHIAYWQDPPANSILRLGKRLLAPFALYPVRQDRAAYWPSFDRVLCVSRAILADLARNTDIPRDRMRVVYNGIDTARFSPPVARRNSRRKSDLRMLYAGSLIWHKGVHTAVAAMATLKQQNQLNGLSLTIVGSGHPDYEAQLRQMVESGGLETAVAFRGRVLRDEMPALLHEFDVLIFPSTWEEPLARMTQEAMAAGLVVIGTLTGGTGEILVEGETGLTFPPEDATKLAAQMRRLRDEPELVQQLSQTARQRVKEQFDISRMIAEIEEELTAIAKN
jgi:glycogen synthase